MIKQGLSFEIEFLIILILSAILVIINLVFLIIHIIKRRKSQQTVPDQSTLKITNPQFAKNPLLAKLQKVIRKLSKPFKPFFLWIGKHKKLLTNLILLPLIVWGWMDLLANPTEVSMYPAPGAKFDQDQGNISIIFNRPLHQQLMKPYIFPEISGEWKFESVDPRFPYFKRKLTFYPHETILPGNKIFVYYSGIANALKPNGNGWELTGADTFHLASPQVVSTTPADQSKNVAVDGSLVVTFDRAVEKYAEWELKIVPEVKHQQQIVDNTLIFTFADHLSQSNTYKYTITRTNYRLNLLTNEIIEKLEPLVISKGSFQTIKEPLIKTITPEGDGILIDAPIEVEFDQPMDQQLVAERFSITPDLDGSLSWISEKKLKYEHSDFAKNTKYTIQFKSGMRSLLGGFTEKKITHSFNTIGPVQVKYFSPGNGASNVKRSSNVSVAFNQAVDHASAQSKFSISPSVAGNFSWSGNTMIFNPNSDFPYQTTYTLAVASGVKTIDGLDSKSTFSSKFTTEVQIFTLNVPIYYQSQSFSCNLVAASMALAYKGVGVSSSTLHSIIPKDSTAYNDNGGDPIWGDPYLYYVGDINGNPKGYGTYWGPLSGVIDNYRSTSIKTGWNRTSLLQEVQNGNPVVVWGHNGYSWSSNGAVGSNISWHTPGGKYIYAIAGMHSYVVVGWVGSIDNPTSIIVNDSNRGRWTMSTSYFDYLWGFFGRSGVVVY